MQNNTSTLPNINFVYIGPVPGGDMFVIRKPVQIKEQNNNYFTEWNLTIYFLLRCVTILTNILHNSTGHLPNIAIVPSTGNLSKQQQNKLCVYGENERLY